MPKNSLVNEVYYSDVPLNFIAHPVTKTIKPLENEDAIKRALRNLILTNNNELFYRPLYGGNITALLFENFSPSLVLEMKEQISECIAIYEERASIESIDINTNVDRKSISIAIVFRPINQVKSTTLSFTVERIR